MANQCRRLNTPFGQSQPEPTFLPCRQRVATPRGASWVRLAITVPMWQLGSAKVPRDLENFGSRQLWSSSLPPTLPVSPLSLLFGELKSAPHFFAPWVLLLGSKGRYLHLSRAVRPGIRRPEVQLLR